MTQCTYLHLERNVSDNPLTRGRVERFEWSRSPGRTNWFSFTLRAAPVETSGNSGFFSQNARKPPDWRSKKTGKRFLNFCGIFDNSRPGIRNKRERVPRREWRELTPNPAPARPPRQAPSLAATRGRVCNACSAYVPPYATACPWCGPGRAGGAP